MRLLIDSHVALWWLEDSPRLGATCRDAIVNADDVYLSVVTPWELGIKRALGKLAFPEDLTSQLLSHGFSGLQIVKAHAERAAVLPLHHRDPFDRMLIAQAQIEQLQLVTADQAFKPYDVDLIEATA